MDIESAPARSCTEKPCYDATARSHSARLARFCTALSRHIQSGLSRFRPRLVDDMLAQLAPQYLAEGVARQRVHKHDGFRPLIVYQLIVPARTQTIFIECLIRANLDG